MKPLRRYWFLGVVVIMALLFAGMAFAGTKDHPRSKSAIFESLDRTVQKNGELLSSRTESVCDNNYYWQGGECWTIDTDGSAMVWGAGGNIYFASASDPTNCVEVAWWEAPLRIRVHNGYAYLFAYNDTSVLDISDPLNPSFLAYYAGWNDGPGYYDAIPSANDDYLFMTRQDQNGFDVYEIATGKLKWEVPNTNPDGAYGWEWKDMFLVEEKGVLILGNMKSGSQGYFDFFDVGSIECNAPMHLYSLEDEVGTVSGLYHTGLVFYRNGYLYGNARPWQDYHPYLDWVFGGGFAPDNFAEVSVWHVPDVTKPHENYFVKHYEASYDIVSMKDTGEGILLGHYQNRVGHFTDQFETHLNSGSFGTMIFTEGMYDGCYFAQKGGVAAGNRGARFFDNTFGETGNRWTGGRISGVVAWGDYLFIPSGAAGLAIVDNSDPTAPTTFSWLAATDQVTQISHVAVSNDGRYAYVSDSYVDPFLGNGALSDKFWVVDLTDMAHPTLVSTTPYTTNGGGTITHMVCIGSYLMVGTTTDLELYGISTGLPIYANSAVISGGCQSVKKFEHPSYPDQDFIGVLGTDWFYTFYINGGLLADTGNMAAANFTNNVGHSSGALVTPVTPFNDFALVNQHVYITDTNANIFPILLTSQSPNTCFSLSDIGTTVWDDFPVYGLAQPKHFVAQVNTNQLAVVCGDGVGSQMIWGVNLQNPNAPEALPWSWQWGLYPSTGFTGFSDYFGGYLYYSDYLMGTAALFDVADYDNPYYIPHPVTGELVTVASYSINDAYSPTTRIIQGTVTLTVQVQDDTTAIPGVIWYYVDLNAYAFRRLGSTAKNTPAGEVGTYTYTFDTTKWRYGNEGYFMALIQDSGCNNYYQYDSITYHINTLPTYEIDWTSADCNAPSWTNCQLDSWIVCGDLDFDIWAFAYPYYMIPPQIWNETQPYPFPAPPDINIAPDPIMYIDDVSQVAYNIDDGPFVLYPVPYGGVDGDACHFMQHITIDTTLLADGLHTLKIRIADDCGLQGFEDIYGQSEWTFNVNNSGPQPYMTAPMAGDVARGSDVRVAAKMQNELAGRPVSLVSFYLDSTDTTTVPQIIATGTCIGSATAKDEFDEYSFSWDASAVPYGDHILVAVVWEGDPCSCGPYRTPIVSFNLISEEEIPPEIATGSSGTDAQAWSEDKITQSWPTEPTATGGYRLYRGIISQLPSLLTTDLDSCLKYEGTDASVDLSADDPSAVEGRLYWYLVTAYNGAGEGPAGNGTAGSRTVNSMGSCPP